MRESDESNKLDRPGDEMRESAPPGGALSRTISELQARVDELSRLIEQITAQLEAAASADVQVILEANRAEVDRAMDNVGEAIAVLQASTSPDSATRIVRSLFLEPIHRWSTTSPLYESVLRFRTASSWPFATGDLLRRGAPAGATASAIVLDDHFRHTVMARAFTNRVRLLAERLRYEVLLRAQAGVGPVRILGLGSRTTTEVVLAAEDPAFAAAVRATVMDDDAASLRDAKRILNGHLREPATFVLADPLQLISGAGRPTRPFHIIHVLSRLDALNDMSAGTVLWVCHELLEPGGALIIGSLARSLSVSERALMESLFGLKPFSRSEADYRRLFARTPFGAVPLHVDHESLGASMVITVQPSSGP